MSLHELWLYFVWLYFHTWFVCTNKSTHHGFYFYTCIISLPGVEVRSYDIIYNLLDDVRAAMEGRLRSVQERVYVGTAEVKAVFGTGKQRVAGCVVTDGVIKVDAVAEVSLVGSVLKARECKAGTLHVDCVVVDWHGRENVALYFSSLLFSRLV